MSTSPDLLEAAYDSILALQRSIAPSKEQVLKELNLTRQQAMTLWCLHHNNRMRVSDLATFHELTKGSVTHLSDSLVELGWVQRITDPDDRRTVYLELTKKGHDLVHHYRRRHFQRMREVLAQFSKEELEALAHLQSKLPKN